MEKSKKKNSTQKKIIIFSIVVSLMLMTACFFIVKALVSEDAAKMKRQVQMVTLLNPPPPPKVEEIPPEPELKEKEEVIEQAIEETHEEMPDDGSDQEAGSDLGVDADGVAGSDGFGLVSKKGGKSLIGGGFGNESLLKKYSWYTQMLQGLIQERLQKELEKNGGIPEGDHDATVRIVIGDAGEIVTFQIVGSSGNQNMDKAISLAVKNIKADDPPPFDMPKAIKLRVSSKG
ncbi:MAG: TonB C-terminal domain-containing protein [Deltaproteobacteria bacterium]|nr:TonB C-terminal domain-containing protein [Deltaproteobacteria bacterium]